MFKRSNSWGLLVMPILVVVLGLAACGGNLPQGDSPEADPIADPQADPLADPEPGVLSPEDLADSELVIYSGRAESLVGPIIEAFERETGVQVAVRWGATAELAATLLEEGQNSPADVFYAQDPGGLGAVSEMFAELDEDLLDLVDTRFRDPGARWIGITGRARVVAYNTDNLTEDDLPPDLWGYTDPSWAGRLGWAPTNASFQAMVTAMRSLWGEEEAAQWLRGILANRPEVFSSNTPVVAAIGSGEIDVGFVNHYYLYRFLAEEGESFPARNFFLPGGGPGSLVLVSGIGILEQSQNQPVAVEFARFLLSPETQALFVEETYEYPLVSGVAAPPGLIPLADLNAVDVPLTGLSDLQGTLQLLREVGALP